MLVAHELSAWELDFLSPLASTSQVNRYLRLSVNARVVLTLPPLTGTQRGTLKTNG